MEVDYSVTMVARIASALLRTPKGGTAHMAADCLAHFASLAHNIGKTLLNGTSSGLDSTLFLPWASQGIPSDDHFTITNKPPQMNHPNFNISEILSKASIDQGSYARLCPIGQTWVLRLEGEADTGVDGHRSCPIKRTRPV